MKKLKVVTIVGTRPELIRLSRVMAALDRHCDHVIVHTGQNYDYELNGVFFEDLGLRKPDHFLEAAGATAAETIGNVIAASSRVLAEVDPDANIIFGAAFDPALADWIAALGVELQVRGIFLVRSQDELAESEYNQMVKLMRETRSPAAYADALEGADYAAECAAWAARFGAENIQARVYDGAAGDAVARFIDCLPARDLPAPEDTAQDAGYANRSIGARALLAARLLNGIEIEARQPLYRKLFAGFAAAGGARNTRRMRQFSS